MHKAHLSLALSLCFCTTVTAAPPTFIPSKLIDLPKMAVMIDSEVQKDLDAANRNLLVFDVHGIFTKETRPSENGHVTLSNRFIPTLKTALTKRARVLAVSSHDKPETLHVELQELRYGHEKGDTVFSDFTRNAPAKKEEGLLLLPFHKEGFKIVHYTRLGDIVSAGIPNLRYKTEKVAAVLISLLTEEDMRGLSISRDTYDKVMAQARDIATDGARTIAANAGGEFYPVKCASASTVETLIDALLEISNLGISADAFADRLNEVIEKRICQRVAGGKRGYPHGRPNGKNKEAIKEKTKDLVAKLMQETKTIQGSVRPDDIEQARQNLFTTTSGVHLFYIDDEYDNVVRFQTDILNTGYFEDGKVYLQYALTPQKDKELESSVLDDRLSEYPEKKRSMDGVK